MISTVSTSTTEMAPLILQSLLLTLVAAGLAPCAAFLAVAPGAAKHTLQRRAAAANSPHVVWNKASQARLRTQTALAAAPRQVTAEELEKEMTEWDLPMILDIFAVWCGPCLMLKPELEKVKTSTRSGTAGYQSSVSDLTRVTDYEPADTLLGGFWVGL